MYNKTIGNIHFNKTEKPYAHWSGIFGYVDVTLTNIQDLLYSCLQH